MRVISFSMLLIIVLIVVGCDTFTGDIDGEMDFNQVPTVEFTNVPLESDTFSYAPVIYWKGRDKDGFVEKYAYADITDSAAIFDPVYYVDFIPEEAWVETEATSDTVYLLTKTGQITEHVFYLKCVDDKEAESEVIYRTFFRSNNPPNVPLIKWWTDPDQSYAHDIVMLVTGNDGTTHPDTFYCLDNITDTWPGLGFSWRSSDADDRDLYTIPLQYRYYLEKVPHDTVWEWVSSDWSNVQELLFSGLETGHYLFSVWCRDDGLEKSSRPATASFDVYKPSFEQPLLLLDVTNVDSNASQGRGDLVPGTQVGELYQQLSEAAGIYGGVDYVRLSRDSELAPWKSFLGRYRLILLFSESFRTSGVTLEDQLIDYVLVGGRLWAIGHFIRRVNLVSDAVLSLANSSYAEPTSPHPGQQPDFLNALPGVSLMPALEINRSEIETVFNAFVRNWDYIFLPGIDIMAVGEGAETVYYYNSYTDTLSGDVIGDVAEVKVFADTIYYPPTPVDCIIKMPKNRILDISRVVNMSRFNEDGTPGVVGEVQSWTNNAWRAGSITAIAKISYAYGEPWSIEDTILVDYRYQPTSQTHLRPCAFRYEKLSTPNQGQGRELRYRIAVFTFPLYYLDNSEGAVNDMFNNMLTWFYQAEAH